MNAEAQSAWDAAGDELKGEGGSFFELDSGNEVDVVVIGQPLVFRTHYFGKDTLICAGEDCAECAKAAAGDKNARMRKRVGLNVYVVSLGKMQILECGPQLFRQLNKQRHLFGKFTMRISKEGSNMNTEWFASPGNEINDELREAAAKAEPFDLRKMLVEARDVAGKVEKTESSSGFSEHDDIPF